MNRSLDSICATLAYAMGIEPPACAAPKNEELAAYIDKVFEGEKAERIVMYNPDAVARWIYEKYPTLSQNLRERADIEIPLRSVMPSVTPVCFGTMYTGAQPEVHGIQKYEKPVITIDTLFDALLRAGKKVALIASRRCSLAHIYLGREIDYFTEHDSVDEINATAAKILTEDKYDFIVIYNGNYDGTMHKNGPESLIALSEYRANCHAYAQFYEMLKHTHKNTLLGFAMDHGCHEIDGDCGSHGLDMDEDLLITHLYKGIKGEKQ